jgi:hypothetical protein
MPDAEICQDVQPRDGWHDRWLAMQSAYAEYRRSSEVLEYTRRSADDPLNDDPLRLTLLEGQQRFAFERYMDARIAFLESRFDELNHHDAGVSIKTEATPGVPQEDSRLKAWLSLVSGKPVLETLAVMLLCTMSFSFMREQRRVRELEAGRDELRAAVIRIGGELDSLRHRLDSAGPVTPAPSQRSQRIPAAPAPQTPLSPKGAGRKPPSGWNTTQQHSPRRAVAANRPPSAETPHRNSGARSVSAFSLSPSREFKRVGPISVLLKSIDARRGTASLSIVTGTARADIQHLGLNQPVWLHTGNHEHPLGLVADRITSGHLYGHLVEPESGKPVLSASGFGPKTDSPQ